MGEITEVAAVLWFDANEEEMTTRIMERAKTSGRTDDNLETLQKRFNQFKTGQMPIIEKYQQKGKVQKINAIGTQEEVTAAVDEIMK